MISPESAEIMGRGIELTEGRGESVGVEIDSFGEGLVELGKGLT